MQLSPVEMRDFYRDGYTVVRGAVAKVQIDAARKAVNHSLGYEGLPPEDLPRMRSQSYCSSIRDASVITNVFNGSPLSPLVESMLGAGNLLPVNQGQIALRFPAGSPQTSRVFTGHMDGIGSGINGTPVGQFNRNFTVLVTVLLQDVLEPFSGNFTVWPESHTAIESYFKTVSPEVLSRGQPEFDLPCDPVQITGRAGDAVISHHQLYHTAAPNHSPDVRYAAIFRARHKLTDQNGTEAMTDIWREWEGLRETIDDLIVEPSSQY